MTDSRLFKRWVLTRTGDDGIRTYESKEPKSDNVKEIQEGFELNEDGTFIEYMQSNSGSLVSYSGKYEIDGDIIYTHFKNHYLDSKLKIEHIHDNLLKIR